MQDEVNVQLDETGNILPGTQRLFFVCLSIPIRPMNEFETVFKEHKEYHRKLEQEGLLFGAGPYLNQKLPLDGTGLIIYSARDYAHAKTLADNDPMHSNGMRAYTLKIWQVNDGWLRLMPK